MTHEFLYITVVSQSQDSIYKIVCKSCWLDYAKSVGRKIWQIAENPRALTIIDSDGKELFKHVVR